MALTDGFAQSRWAHTWKARARHKGEARMQGHESHRILIIKKKIYANVKELAKKAKVKKMS